jgi:hypothetical protein
VGWLEAVLSPGPPQASTKASARPTSVFAGPPLVCRFGFSPFRAFGSDTMDKEACVVARLVVTLTFMTQEIMGRNVADEMEEITGHAGQLHRFGDVPITSSNS